MQNESSWSLSTPPSQQFQHCSKVWRLFVATPLQSQKRAMYFQYIMAQSAHSDSRIGARRSNELTFSARPTPRTAIPGRVSRGRDEIIQVTVALDSSTSLVLKPAPRPLSAQVLHLYSADIPVLTPIMSWHLCGNPSFTFTASSNGHSSQHDSVPPWSLPHVLALTSCLDLAQLWYVTQE